MATLNRMERFRGHLYNWYDTQDLRPLEPKYVSSVDSGNLAGHLLALANACRERVCRPVMNPALFSGLEDGLELTRESLSGLSDDRRTQTVTRKQLDDALASLAASLRQPPSHPLGIATRLEELAAHALAVADIARTLGEERGDAASSEIVAWAAATEREIESHRRDAVSFMPWAQLAASQHETGDLCDAIPTLAELPELCDLAISAIAHRASSSNAASDGGEGAAPPASAKTLADLLLQSSHASRSLVRRLAALESSARELAQNMEFGFLLDPDRKLLSIGYAVAEGALDPSCYDLLASEARLASFFAIAKGDIPATHWFRLGRSVTPVERGAALISWSGSMFEYLMPSLVMNAPVGSLLEQTCQLVVRRQIAFGNELGVPWGIS